MADFVVTVTCRTDREGAQELAAALRLLMGAMRTAQTTSAQVEGVYEARQLGRTG